MEAVQFVEHRGHAVVEYGHYPKPALRRDEGRLEVVAGAPNNADGEDDD